MLPEQQQRILGYFIEEARDHLHTIEQGLLNLQSTLNDPEMINEVFRAAHSIKGGAAMLGLSSIQHTSHRLEDCFKILKDTPIQVDQKLESLFLGVSDTLKALLEHLSGPFGLSEEAASTLMSETEPVFQWLNEHLEQLVEQRGAGVVGDAITPSIAPNSADSVGTLTEIFFRQDVPTTAAQAKKTFPVPPPPFPVVATSNDQWSEFQTQVLHTLREMLQLFKQSSTSASRQSLQECCNQLVKLGKTWNLPNWANLCKAAANAIANQENTYLTLAKIVITEIKQAQELILQNRESEITISHRLESLWGFPDLPLLEVAQNLLGDVPMVLTPSLTTSATPENQLSHESSDATIAPTDSVTSLTEISEQLVTETITTETYITEDILLVDEDRAYSSTNKTHSHGPEVGLAELNTLADLFEGETPELDATWQQEEILDEIEPSELGANIHETIIQEFDHDIADFLSLDGEKEESVSTTNTTEDLGLLFGDIFLDKDNLESQHLFKSSITASEILQEHKELDSQSLDIVDTDDVIEDLLTLTIDDNISSDLTSKELESASNFDDLFIERDINTGTIEEIKLPQSPDSRLITTSEEVSLDNLLSDLPENTQLSPEASEIGDLFDVPSATGLEFDQTEDDLGNFWNQETEIEPESILESGVEQNIAQALEDSLFAAVAGGEIFSESQYSISSLEDNLEVEDLNITFLQENRDLDLLFSSDAQDDLFAELTVNDTNIDNISDRSPSLPEIAGFSQPPEALDFIPEFTNQSHEEIAGNSSLSFTELEVDLFSEIDELNDADSLENIESLDSQDLLATATTLDLQQEQYSEVTVEFLESSEEIVVLELDDDLSELSDDITDIRLDFAALSETESELELGDNLSDLSDDITDIRLDFAESIATESAVELGDALTERDIEFAALSETENKLELDHDLSGLTDELTEIGLDFAESIETESVVELSNALPQIENEFAALSETENELKLDHELSALTDDPTEIGLDFAELIETESVVGLGDALTESDIELAGLSETENELELDHDLSALTDDIAEIGLDFAELIETESVVGLGDLLTENDIELAPLSETENELELDHDLSALTDEIAEIGLDFAESISTESSVELGDLPTESNIELAALSETENELELDHDLSALTDDIIENHDSRILTQTTEENLEVTAVEISAETTDLVISVSETEISESVTSDTESQDEFADLEALLEVEILPPTNSSSIPDDDFAALEALLGEDDTDLTVNEQPPAIAQPQPQKLTLVTPITSSKSIDPGDEFSDLEKLLAEADQTISHSSSIKQPASKPPRGSRRNARFEETMKVPVKQLDDMSNLVGELVVNRNTLEQDHERLRQSLDNLLVQVQQLSDVGARMQELYERSLLEASLLASRKPKEITYQAPDANSDRGFSELEMDRFTPFHSLSQEMIELIVRVRESASDIDFVTEETERVARQFRQVTTQLQEGLTRARMVPFSQTIDRLRRGVRDNAIKFGKQVELVIEGGDTLIDKMILDHLNDPFTHMLNNAIAHGIETPEIRQASGKSPVGTITIRAFYQGNQTIISVGDDGAGIDPERIKAKAMKLGIMTPQQAKIISRLEIYDLLFQAGFSTKDEADEISGRGVGMDVVRSEISEIRGAVSTDSTVGKGTTFTIRLPLTLSICKALCCVSDKARIAFPMDGVEDTLDIPSKNVQHNADGQSYISWRDTVLPFRPLKDLLTFNRQISRGGVYGGTRDDDMISVVVVRSGNTLIALQIDLVLSEQEIVIKQFEGPAPKPMGVAGATVLGDGRIMPIADVLEIIDIFQGRMSKYSGTAPWQQTAPPVALEVPAVKIDPTVLIVDDSITVRELLSLTFNKAGYRVEQARDGQEAWDKLRSGLPCDIVFCDIEMPRCDGLELLSRIQKDSNLNHLPIAMLTSRGADKHRQMAIQLGASGYFTKPYLEEALLEAAVRMLKGEKLVTQTNA